MPRERTTLSLYMSTNYVNYIMLYFILTCVGHDLMIIYAIACHNAAKKLRRLRASDDLYPSLLHTQTVIGEYALTCVWDQLDLVRAQLETGHI